MGLRFRKSIKLAPGVRLNLGKKSAGVSFGGKGVRHTISTTGRRTTTVGIPGSGLSYSHTSGGKKSKTNNAEGKTNMKKTSKQKVKKPITKRWWFYPLIVCLVLGGIGNACSDKDADKQAEEAHVAAVEEETEVINLGFDVVPFWCPVNLDAKKLQETLDYIFDFAEEEGLPNDGIVFKFNDIEYGKSLGATSHHFKNGIAYKKKDDVYETELIDIEFTMGKTGVLTPTAVFKPVEIDGTTVERASVHNISILQDLNLCIRDTIEVYKANQIIPQVKRNISAEQRKYIEAIEADTVYIPEYCPICGGKTGLVTENSSTVLMCMNDNCKGKLLGKLTHYVSKNAMNVDGLSESTLEKFIELDLLNSFEDIYNLKYHVDKIMSIDGFAEKSVKKLLKSIEKSENTTLDRFIYALSIPLIGRSASKTIAKYFNGDFDKFYYECCMNKFDFTILDDFGESMNKSINNYIANNDIMIVSLSSHLYFEKVNTINNVQNLSGKTFVITGSLNQFANRDEAKARIEACGGKVSGSVSAKTSYLVNNDTTSTSGKNKKAKELNIPIISEDELIEMLNK